MVLLRAPRASLNDGIKGSIRAHPRSDRTVGRDEEAHVVLLSIRSSRTMVGAVALEAVADVIHGALKSRDLAVTLRPVIVAHRTSL